MKSDILLVFCRDKYDLVEATHDRQLEHASGEKVRVWEGCRVQYHLNKLTRDVNGVAAGDVPCAAVFPAMELSSCLVSSSRINAMYISSQNYLENNMHYNMVHWRNKVYRNNYHLHVSGCLEYVVSL